MITLRRSLWLPLIVTLLTCSWLASRPARAATVARDVVYAEAGGEELRLDIYPAARGAGLRPAVVLIHGGGWRGGDKANLRGIGIELAQLGYTCFAVNYRLAPQHPYPAAIDDVQLAVRWIRAGAGDHRVDPQRIGAWGVSTGGHLAQFLGVIGTINPVGARFDDLSSRVSCVVNFQGPTDLTDVKLPIGMLAQAQRFLKSDRSADAKRWSEASPLTFVSDDDAPTLFCHGAKDEVVPLAQSEAFAAKLRAVGVESRLVVVSGGGHVFARGSQGDKDTRQAARAFLGKHLKP